MWYTFARAILKTTKWLWTVALIPLILTLIAVFVPLFVQAKPSDLLYAFIAPGPVRTTTLLALIIVFGVLLLVPLISWLFLLTEVRAVSNRSLRKYLQAVVEAHQGLNPRGFAQQTALISVNVPLDDIFIHLNAVSDRPLFDMPYEQQQLLAELRLGTRADLTPEQQQELIDKLRVRWYSQLGQNLVEGSVRHDTAIEDVLKLLRAERPVAIILGQPGSGKSTTMRWFALHMARACLSPRYSLADEMAPRQIPLLVRIGDYAKRLAVEDLSFKGFLEDYLTLTYPEVSGLWQLLLSELLHGRCLALFDGLDEVASDSLRRRVAEKISQFIADYDAETPGAHAFNRFIVTSRIVGYEAGTFNRYAHYTLLDLQDQQITQFLTNWCPAVEGYQARAAQGMNPLTEQQEKQAKKAGDEQRDRLLEALRNNPSIKRLAANPLMLTILALIQRSGRTLPHRRIELYQVVTRTMLDNWNQEKGSRVFSVEEIPLAEQLLSELAFRLHSSSGLFVESGQGLFGFMHRTFQEYYTARYLLRKPAGELKSFVKQHYIRSTWREPLLLAIADRSTQSGLQERQEASDLIETIASAHDEYEAILHRALLLAANCMVDCSPWSIDGSMQRHIANRLFDLYGDAADACRYTQLQRDALSVALSWLRGQPAASHLEAPPPLLSAWRTALCDTTHAVCQEGATHLLASLAPDLPTCPRVALDILLPALLSLAGVADWYRHDLTCPSQIRAQLVQARATPATERVADYALIALRLLGAHGPAGWLHADWLRWNQEHPELLARLARHSLELDYLLMPAALPDRSDDPNWDKQLEIGQSWKQLAQRDPVALQAQLMRYSDAARYPQAYLYKQLLEAEQTSLADQSWRATWDVRLKDEMARGKPATFQTCITLRLLLHSKDQEGRQAIADELMTALRAQPTQSQAMIAITNIDLQYLQDLRDLRDLQDLRDLRDLQQIIEILCNLLDHSSGRTVASELLTLYSAVATTDQPGRSQVARRVQSSLNQLAEQSRGKLTVEERQLVTVILRELGPDTPARRPTSDGKLLDTPDERTHALNEYKSKERLSSEDIVEMLSACADSREPSQEMWKELTGDDRQYGRSVGKFAWKLLNQPFALDLGAQETLVRTLGDKGALACAVAALILQDGKGLSRETREQAGAKIMEILRDEDLSRRPLDPPDGSIERLDDVLFETLRKLVDVEG